MMAFVLRPAYREIASGSSATRQSRCLGSRFTASTSAAKCSSGVSAVTATSGSTQRTPFLRLGAVFGEVAGRCLLHLARSGLLAQLLDAPVELVVLAQRGRVRELGQGADRQGAKLIVLGIVEHDPSGLGLEPVRRQRLQRDGRNPPDPGVFALVVEDSQQ